MNTLISNMAETKQKLSLTLILLWTNLYNAYVHWFTVTDPIVFGENVKLMCSIKGSSCNKCPVRWHGGKSLQLISINTISSNSSKYTLTNESEGIGLIIHDFQVIDVNVDYRCSFGFQHYQHNLSMKSNFQYQPSNETLQKSMTVDVHNVLNVKINFLKVHPVPECNMSVDENLAPVLNTTIRKQDLFYSVVLNIQHLPVPNVCIEAIQILCLVGTRMHSLFNEDIKYKCRRNIDNPIFKWWTVVVPSVVTLTVVLMSIILCVICRKKRNSSCRKQHVKKSTKSFKCAKSENKSEYSNDEPISMLTHNPRPVQTSQSNNSDAGDPLLHKSTNISE